MHHYHNVCYPSHIQSRTTRLRRKMCVCVCVCVCVCARMCVCMRTRVCVKCMPTVVDMLDSMDCENQRHLDRVHIWAIPNLCCSRRKKWCHFIASLNLWYLFLDLVLFQNWAGGSQRIFLELSNFKRGLSEALHPVELGVNGNLRQEVCLILSAKVRQLIFLVKNEEPG